MQLKDAMTHVAKIVHTHVKPTTEEKYVGIEVEMLSPLSRDLLALLIAKGDLEQHVNLGTDGSIETDDGNEPAHEGLYGIEARICCKQSEYFDVLTRFFKIVKGNGCTVNATCGLHVHIDARKRDIKKMMNNFYNSQELLYSVIKPSRRLSQYCSPMSPDDKDDFDCLSKDDLMDEDEMDNYRRKAINFVAYHKHKTLEIRAHHPTMNAVEVAQWITFLLSIADSPAIKDGWKLLDTPTYPEALKLYIKRKIKQYGKWSYEAHQELLDRNRDEEDNN